MSYSACTLKPGKRARRGLAENEATSSEGKPDAVLKLGLHQWKKVECLRYRFVESDRLDDKAQLSMVAMGRDAKQARLYSLHHGATASTVGDASKSKSASWGCHAGESSIFHDFLKES